MIMWFIFVPGFLSVTSIVYFLLMGGELRSFLVAGLVLCVTLIMALFYRPTRWYAAFLTIAIPLFLMVALRPVCVPLDDFQVQVFNPPIEQRTDRDLYFDVFQKRPDGGWNQCKTQVSRWFFY